MTYKYNTLTVVYDPKEGQSAPDDLVGKIVEDKILELISSNTDIVHKVGNDLFILEYRYAIFQAKLDNLRVTFKDESGSSCKIDRFGNPEICIPKYDTRLKMLMEMM